MNKKANVGITLEFKDVFPNETPRTVLGYLKGISQKKVLLVGSSFLGHHSHDSQFMDLKNLFRMWFSQENAEFANAVYLRLVNYQKKHDSLIRIINPYTSLKLFELACEKLKEDEIQKTTEIEQNLFKAYILLTQNLNEKDNTILDSLKDQPDDLKIPFLFLTQSFRYSDIMNNELGTVFVTEFIRSIIFFEFLEAQEQAKALLTKFCQDFKVDDWRDYLRRITGLCVPIIHKKTEGHLNITIENNVDREKDKAVLDNLILSDFSEVEEFDFKILRGRPFLKIDDFTYRVIYSQFAVEKIHQGLYFVLSQTNQSLDKKDQIKNFRQFYTYNYSEQFALYWILRSIYGEKYIQVTGQEFEEFGIEGAPDYYLRNGNKVFLFESKDVLISAEIKESVEFAQYEKELKKKFYFDSTSGKKKKKAILQLLSNIDILLKGKFRPDESYNAQNIKIYPIILVHNKIFNIPGLNILINLWFRSELEKLNDGDINLKNVRDIVVMDIGTLIYHHDLLKYRKVMLENLIDDYFKYTNIELKPKPKDENEREYNLLETIKPFSSFVDYDVSRKRINRVTSLFKEKGFDLVIE